MTLRVVVVGSGSAGRRHAASLRRLRPAADIVMVRRAGRAPLPHQIEQLGVSVVPTLETATAAGCDLAIVASPATSHSDDASFLVERAAATLIEKPLAASVDEGEHLATVATGRRVVVGYHLRWSETVQAFASAVVDELPGPPQSFELSVGQHLSQWRPGVDPRDGVSARAELGGGVLLELSHELDAVHHLIGPVRSVSRAELRTDGAPTDGTVDTVADVELELCGGARGTVHLDMTSDPPHRRWCIRSGAVSVVADLLAGTVHVDDGNEVHQVHQSAPGERDRAEDAMISHLLALGDRTGHDERVEPACSVGDALATLRVVAAARAAAEHGSSIDVGPGPQHEEAVAPG